MLLVGLGVREVIADFGSTGTASPIWICKPVVDVALLSRHGGHACDNRAVVLLGVYLKSQIQHPYDTAHKNPG